MVTPATPQEISTLNQLKDALDTAWRLSVRLGNYRLANELAGQYRALSLALQREVATW